MRHDMSQVLSTPHPHATLSRKQPPLPLTPLPPTYLRFPYSPSYWTLSLAGWGLPLGLTSSSSSLSVWKWRCESVKVICKVDVAIAVPCRARCSCRRCRVCCLLVAFACCYGSSLCGGFYVSRHRNLKCVRVRGVRMHKERAATTTRKKLIIYESAMRMQLTYII